MGLFLRSDNHVYSGFVLILIYIIETLIPYHPLYMLHAFESHILISKHACHCVSLLFVVMLCFCFFCVGLFGDQSSVSVVVYTLYFLLSTWGVIILTRVIIKEKENIHVILSFSPGRYQSNPLFV